MSLFIRQAACKGRRPSHIGTPRYTERPDLVARLLRQRRVPRFVFASSGYGKTLLAADYCMTVFAFSHVFWIRAASPCFLRDLDGGGMAAAIGEADEDAALVVFDDIPALDPARIRAFREVLARLSDRGCEVLALGGPGASACAEGIEEKMILSASDLLLSEREMEAAIGCSDLAGRGHAPSAIERIPALAWSNAPEELDTFLNAILREECPPETAVAVAGMMAVGSGRPSEALAGIPHAQDALARFARTYPHLGISEEADWFDCREFPAENVAYAIRPLIGRLAAHSLAGTRDGLVESWAAAALERRSVERACDIMRILALQAARGAWAAAYGYRLVRSGAFLPLRRLIDSAGTVEPALRERMSVLEVICRWMIEDRRQAALQGRRIAFDGTSGLSARIVCLVALVRAGQGALAERALGDLAEILDNASDEQLDAAASAVQLARGVLAEAQGSEFFASFLAHACVQHAGRLDDALCVLSSWFFDGLALRMRAASDPVHPMRAIQAAGGASAEGPAFAVPAAVEDFVCEMAGSLAAGAPNAFAASAGLSMERARMEGVALGCAALPARIQLILRQAETDVLGQRMRAELDAAQAERIRAARLKSYPDMLSAALPAFEATVQTNTPLLSVHLFGGLQVRIGSEPVSDRRLRREKVRRLLVMLAINRGRELGRDHICEQLWPQSTLDVSRKSFYNVFSELRHALSLPDGTCPYLTRRRLSCGIDGRTVTTDMARLDEICRELMFGEPDDVAWANLYREIDSDFREELMASEMSDPYVLAARAEQRSRLVDALTTASQRITSAGVAEQGIWFARSAVEHDRTREDAYIALMVAQRAAGQRAAAIMTFTALKRVLADELGVDPSPEARALYERILLDDVGASAMGIAAAC